MIVLYIILGLLFLLFLLLNIPVYFELRFKEELSLKIKYLKFSFSVFPKEEKHNKIEEKSDNKNEELKPEKKSKKKENYISKLFKQKGLSGFLSILKELTVLSTEAIRKIFLKILIDKINLDIMVVGEDACDTALKTGKIKSFISLCLLKVVKDVNSNRYNVNIYPGFSSEKTKVDFYARIHFKPISILNIAVVTAFKFVKSVYKNQKKLQRERV